MKKNLLIFLFSIFGFLCANGQQLSADSLIYLNGFNWKMGEKKMSPSDFRRDISKHPVAMPYLKKGNKNAVLSKVFFAGAALFSLASILNSDDPYYYTGGRRQLSYNLLAVSSFVAGAITFKYSLKNKGKAVHLRNMEILH